MCSLSTKYDLSEIFLFLYQYYTSFVGKLYTAQSGSTRL